MHKRPGVLLTLVLSLTLAAGLFSAAPAYAQVAETKVHAEAGVEIGVPAGWSAEPDEDMLVLASPDEGVALVLMVLEGEDLEAALDALDEELAALVSDIEVSGEPEAIETAGMSGISIEGRGKMDGADVELALVVLESPTGKMLLLLGMGEKGAVETHERAISEVFMSLKPSK